LARFRLGAWQADKNKWDFEVKTKV